MTKTVTLKKLIADPNKRIELHDFVVESVQRLIEESPLSNLVEFDRLKAADLQGVLERSHTALGDLAEIAVLLGYWAERFQISELEEFFNRLIAANMGDDRQLSRGTLNWYPVYILLCAAGISSVSSKNFESLRAILTLPVRDTHETTSLGVFVLTKMIQFDESFKSIPGHEKHRVPRSEHLLISIRPIVEPYLKLGPRFEGMFDEFEVIVALVFADLSGREWGPPGRFAYKRRGGDDPFDRVLKSAEVKGRDWEVLRAGFFGGSQENFNKVTATYLERLGPSWF